MSTIMDRRAISKSIISSLISGVSPKWTAYVLKREALDVKRDPKGNFMDLTSKEVRGDTMEFVEELKNRAASSDKVSCTRTEIFISNFTSATTEVEYCKKSNETVASPYYCTGLVGVFVDENHELENLTAKNPVFICKCRKNLYQYKPHVNCDELVISAALIRQDFQRIEVVAGSSYVIESGAVYFWFSLSYCHVIVHKRANSTCFTSGDERMSLRPGSSPIKASVVNDISNGILAASRRNYAKRPRLKSCLKMRAQQFPEPSTSTGSSDREVYVVDDEVHVMCDAVDLSESCDDSCECDRLRDEITLHQCVIDQRNADIRRLMTKLSKQQQQIERLKKNVGEKDEEIAKLKEELCSRENEKKELKRIVRLQYDSFEQVRTILE